MGGGFFAGYYLDFEGFEAGGLEHAVEVGFGEAEPCVGVHFAGLLELMGEEVEDGDAAAGLEEAMGGGDGAGGVVCVVEGLAEEGEIDGAGGDGRVFDVAEAVFEVGEAVVAGEGGAEFDHFLGVVDGDDLAGVAGEELGEGAFAGAEVGYDDGAYEGEEEVGDAFPGAAGTVAAAKTAGEAVEVFAGFVLALAEDELEGGEVAFGLGDLAGAGGDQLGNVGF